jgi:hypothetical protein
MGSYGVIDYPSEISFLWGARMYYIGIDHRRQYSHFTLPDERSEVVKSEKTVNLRRELKKGEKKGRSVEKEEGGRPKISYRFVSGYFKSGLTILS